MTTEPAHLHASTGEAGRPPAPRQAEASGGPLDRPCGHIGARLEQMRTVEGPAIQLNGESNSTIADGSDPGTCRVSAPQLVPRTLGSEREHRAWRYGADMMTGCLAQSACERSSFQALTRHYGNHSRQPLGGVKGGPKQEECQSEQLFPSYMPARVNRR